MGEDNLKGFHKWKNYEQILANHEIYVYKRPQYDLGDLADHPKIKILEAPLMQISDSYIRRCIQKNQSIQYLVPDAVFEYINKNALYRSWHFSFNLRQNA